MGLCLPRGGQEIPTAASSCTPNTSGQPATVYTPLHEHKTHHCAKYAAFYAGPGAGNPNVPSALLMPACSVSAFLHNPGTKPHGAVRLGRTRPRWVTARSHGIHWAALL